MKVAILGTENSHAFSFAKILNTTPCYSDVEIVGLYGPEENNRQIIDAGYASYAAKSPDEFVGKVDAVIVTARHGDLHYDYAIPYIKAGTSAFIDKPFTVSIEKAEELILAAKHSGANICGGSGLRHLEELAPLRRLAKKHRVLGGNVSAPINMVNEYGGFYFYASHLVSMLTTVFGYDVKKVLAYADTPENNRVSAIFRYDGFDVTANYSSSPNYTATVLTDKGAQSTVCSDVGYIYEYEVAEIVNMVKSGKQPESFDDFLFHVRILHAIENSYLTGKEILL